MALLIVLDAGEYLSLFGSLIFHSFCIIVAKILLLSWDNHLADYNIEAITIQFGDLDQNESV